MDLGKILFLVLVYFVTICKARLNILYPASFTVVRSSSINVDLLGYMQQIGHSSADQNGFNLGYNIISLDGYKTGMTFSSVNNELSPLSTWVNVYSRIMGNTKNHYGKSSSDIQNYILNSFHSQASRILFNAFSFQRPISQKNANPVDEATNIAQFVNMYNFDGVSIDFDDFHSVKDETASSWLTLFLKTLKKQIGKNKLIVLQTYPTFVTELQIFKNPLVNSWVDLFVLKYYNLLKENYVSFDSIFNKGGFYSGTGLWEIQKNSTLIIDTCKTLIAKPANPSGTWTGDAYLSGSVLGGIFEQGRSQLSWFGGYANLDFGSDPKGEYQLAVLSSLRSYCNKLETCFCF